MARDLNYQTRVLDQDWAAAAALRALGSKGLNIFVVIGAKELAQIGMERAFPGYGEDFSNLRCVLLYSDTGRGLNFVQGVGIAAAGAQRALHFGDVFLDRGCFPAQRG
jgi:hypothetical protein